MSGQSVGDLVVNLGIQGSEKTISAVQGVQDGLSKVTGLSLEAKAAIVGAFYALEQLFSDSATTGTQRYNASTLLGISTKVIQQFTYAYRQSNPAGSINEMAAALGTLRDKMEGLLYHGQNIQGFWRVAQVLKGRQAFTKDEMLDFIQNPQDLMLTLQEYVKREKGSPASLAIAKDMFTSFGLTPAMFTSALQGVYTKTNFNNAPLDTEGQVTKLHALDVAWGNLDLRIQRAFDHFNALHGGDIVKDLTALVTPSAQIAENFAKIAENIKVFQGVDYIFRGWAILLKQIADVTSGKGNAVVGNPGYQSGPEFWQGLFNYYFPPDTNKVTNQIPIGERIDAIINRVNSSSLNTPWDYGVVLPTTVHNSDTYNTSIELHGVVSEAIPKVVGDLIDKKMEQHHKTKMKRAAANLNQTRIN